MRAKAIQLSGYTFRDTDKLLLDTNVWLYIYGPPGSPGDWKSSAYSKAFFNAKTAGSQIYIDVLILSEFVNRYARLEHSIRTTAGIAPPNFKTFRDSPMFSSIAQSIAQDARRILKSSICIESDFSRVAMGSLLADFESGHYDLNDQILSALCKKSGYLLMTHDGDFSKHDVTVLSANNRFFSTHS